MGDIGGYFELELHEGAHYYHNTPYAMKSGRSSLHCILSLVKPSLVHVPFYTCNALLEPFETTGVNFRFYGLNKDLDPEKEFPLREGEYFLYVNYFDLKRDTVERLSKKYKDKLIIDATQAFFMRGNGVSWFFNSCRKFFGVPDGSYLYTPEGMPVPLIEERNEEYITAHLIKRFNGHTAEGYEDFTENEGMVDDKLRAMSRLSDYLLSGVDYGAVIEKRQSNYSILEKNLGKYNRLKLHNTGGAVPMCYPFIPDRKIDKKRLSDRGIFIPSFWKDVQRRDCNDFEFEQQFADLLWPLPVDHRYGADDMERIVKELLTWLR